jgi:hypothetical protein
VIIVVNQLLADLSDGDFHASPEDWLPEMFRADLPSGLHVGTRLKDGQELPFALVAESVANIPWASNEDHMSVVGVDVNTFTDGVDAEVDGFRFHRVLWRLLRSYSYERRVFDSGRSSVAYARVLDQPHRRPDWADATGPVQYQDLPAGVERFISSYLVVVHHHSGA